MTNKNKNYLQLKQQFCHLRDLLAYTHTKTKSERYEIIKNYKHKQNNL